ncbi:ABC transporter ATP-binding protein [Limnohabitans sp. Rim8]|uniref:ABC transporter ATP-binding protein n=1 Tax=Limnohabitans sp. Rim8 TaxID=1100718 RepID=UPI00330634E0
MTATLQVKNLKVSFDMGRAGIQHVLHGVSFDVPDQRTLALVGESGSGKSVSALSISRLLPDNALMDPASQILSGGVDLLKLSEPALRKLRGKEITTVFQDPMNSLNPVKTIGHQIAEVLILHLGLSPKQAWEQTKAVIDEVGIPDAGNRINAYPHELSGGQQQRVMIAIAIACQPRLLIADEPTTALDVTVQRQIIELLVRLQDKHKMSMLFISHDLGLVAELAHEVVVMRHGEVRESGSVESIFTRPQDAYTQALLACRPRLNQAYERLPVIEDFMNPAGRILTPRAPPASGGEVLMTVDSLAKDYVIKTGLFSRKTVHAVKDASFSLRRGETLGVVGESGSGKSTLGLMLAQLLQVTRGEVTLAGHALTRQNAAQIRAMRKKVQIIFQNPYASLNPRFTVGRILEEPLKIHGLGGDEVGRQALVLEWLERVGLGADALHKYPHEFSGGQRQRISIARSLILQPEIVVCDESVSALDVSVQATILNLLKDLQKEFSLAYLFISHDLDVVRYMSDQMIVMKQGDIVERGAAADIYANPQHPYTQELLGSIPKGWTAERAAALA